MAKPQSEGHESPQLARLLALVLVLLASSACVSKPEFAQASPGTTITPDSAAVTLAAMGEQALKLVQKETPSAVLRQVDTDLNQTDFRFTDDPATKEIIVLVPAAGVPPDKWVVEQNDVSPLVGNTEPGLDLRQLRVGPGQVAQAISAHWPGCALRGMTLYNENNRPTWVAFCNVAEGVVSGIMDGKTGVFEPSAAPPARLPVTATPSG